MQSMEVNHLTHNVSCLLKTLFLAWVCGVCGVCGVRGVRGVRGEGEGEVLVVTHALGAHYENRNVLCCTF